MFKIELRIQHKKYSFYENNKKSTNKFRILFLFFILLNKPTDGAGNERHLICFDI